MTTDHRKASCAEHAETVSVVASYVQALLPGAGSKDTNDLMQAGNHLVMAATILRGIAVRQEGA